MHAYRHSYDSLFPWTKKLQGRERLKALLEPELPEVLGATQGAETCDRGRRLEARPRGLGLRIPTAQPEDLALYREEPQADCVVFSPQS